MSAGTAAWKAAPGLLLPNDEGKLPVVRENEWHLTDIATNNIFSISGPINYNGGMDIWRCYEILEIEPDASPEEIKRVYRDLVLVWHPDRFADNPRLRQKAEEKLKEVNLAYEVVTGPKANSTPPPSSSRYAEERRKFPRFPCALALTHSTFDRVLSSMGDSIRNISAGGMFINTKENFFIGETVTLSFSLPRFGSFINLASEVVRVCPDGVAVQFRISDRYQKLLAEVV